MRKKLSNILIFLLISLSLSSLLLTGCGFFDFSNDGTISGISGTEIDDDRSVVEINFEMVDPPVAPGSNLVKILKEIHPSVVSIKISSSRSSSAGSGVVIAADDLYSYIVTCEHVVASSASSPSIHVTLSEGETQYAALRIGGNATEDIALLRIRKTGIPIAKIRNTTSGPIQLGEDVIVIGNPLGSLGGTVTQGIISGLARQISVEGVSMTLLQSDAAINSGNSGGGMFDENGLLIGIVNAKSAEEKTEGLGFAIPIENAVEVIKVILKTFIV
ncbi:MAG: S1C family serine protease [Christensenellaceae bacterium]|jgi:serine protease Do|nr:S1C family serine protease [Christensenellaceae bacterium]